MDQIRAFPAIRGEDFFKTDFERRHRLFSDAVDPDRFNDVSLASMEYLIQSGALRTGEFDVIDQGSGGQKPEYLQANGLMDGSAVLDALEAGRSLRLFSIHRRFEQIEEVRRQLSVDFGANAFANAYFTPPGKQGFNPHFDSHEVFIVQLEGQKRWSIFDVGPENVVLPLRHERFSRDKYSPGEKIDEFVLEPGDLLYIPRGRFHCAQTASTGSLHLTFGIEVTTWATVLIELLADASKSNPVLRSALLPDTKLSPGKVEAVKRALSEYLDDMDGLHRQAERCLRDSVDSPLSPIRPRLQKALRTETASSALRESA